MNNLKTILDDGWIIEINIKEPFEKKQISQIVLNHSEDTFFTSLNQSNMYDIFNIFKYSYLIDEYDLNIDQLKQEVTNLIFLILNKSIIYDDNNSPLLYNRIRIFYNYREYKIIFSDAVNMREGYNTLGKEYTTTVNDLLDYKQVCNCERFK